MPLAVEEEERFVIGIVEVGRGHTGTPLVDARGAQQFAHEQEVALDPVGLEGLEFLGDEMRRLAIVARRDCACLRNACAHADLSRLMLSLRFAAPRQDPASKPRSIACIALAINKYCNCYVI
jgi:hypothetical protein